MKVKCIKLVDEQTGEHIENSSWLTIGFIYDVLSIYMRPGLPLKFQLIGNDRSTPAYHDANQFIVVSNKIPSNWGVYFESGFYFRLSPIAWSKPGFWEEYFDGVPEAIDLFNSEKNKILLEDTYME